MKEVLKKNYFEILIVLLYTTIACIVYGIWFQSLWGLWYITLITILVIIAIGISIGYLYMKSVIKKKENPIEKHE